MSENETLDMRVEREAAEGLAIRRANREQADAKRERSHLEHREKLSELSDEHLHEEAERLFEIKNKKSGFYKSAVHERGRLDIVVRDRKLTATAAHVEYVDVLKVAQDRFGTEDLFRANKALAAAVGAAS